MAVESIANMFGMEEEEFIHEAVEALGELMDIYRTSDKYTELAEKMSEWLSKDEKFRMVILAKFTTLLLDVAAKTAAIKSLESEIDEQLSNISFILSL